MQLIQRDILRTYTLEIIPTAIGQTSFTFPDIPFLRNKISYAIETSIAFQMVTTGKDNRFGQVNFTYQSAGFITLVDSDNNQFVQNMPIIELQTQYNFTPSTTSPPSGTIAVATPYNTNGLTIFTERIVQWNKCSMFFNISPISALTQGFQFTIYYK